MIEQAIYSRLTAAGAQTQAIVGTAVYPDVNLATGTRYVVYEVDDTTSAQNMAGASGLDRNVVTVSVVGAAPEQCGELADAVRADLDGQGGTWGGVVVQGAFLEGGDGKFYPISDGADRRAYAKDLKFTVWAES